MPARLACTGISKEYRTTSGQRSLALDNVSLEINEGEFLTVVGSSGSGKSTLLRILAGIDQPSAGSTSLDDEKTRLKIGFVFQGNAVFPWRTVEGNLSYALDMQNSPNQIKRGHAVELCNLVGLVPPETFLEKYPHELSGGESRRVAIGMALSAGASLLLFDEATSQLDYISRLTLQMTIQKLWLEKNPTIVYVTHDIDEAIFLATRIVVLSRGRLRDILNVPFGFPRDRRVLSEARSLEIREEVLRHLDVSL